MEGGVHKVEFMAGYPKSEILKALSQISPRQSPHPSKQHALAVSPGSTTHGFIFPAPPVRHKRLPVMEIPPLFSTTAWHHRQEDNAFGS